MLNSVPCAQVNLSHNLKVLRAFIAAEVSCTKCEVQSTFLVKYLICTILYSKLRLSVKLYSCAVVIFW